MSKKKEKDIEHATKIWERDQIKAASRAEQLDKARAVVERYKKDLTENQYRDVLKKLDEESKELANFLLAARDKYVAKLDQYNIEAVLPVEKA
jgi:hypothetical protein